MARVCACAPSFVQRCMRGRATTSTSVSQQWWIVARGVSSRYDGKHADEELLASASDNAEKAACLVQQTQSSAESAVNAVIAAMSSSSEGRPHTVAAAERDKDLLPAIDPRTLNPNRLDRQRMRTQADGGRDGWFAIGIFRNKHLSNHGTLWRTAWQLGAAYLFTVQDRFGHSSMDSEMNSDTAQAWKRLPSFRFEKFEDLIAVHSDDVAVVAIEMGGEPLEHFCHPSQAVYLLGSEDQGLPPAVVARCTHHVELPAVREASLNVATCGALVMYDRELKLRLGANIQLPALPQHNASTRYSRFSQPRRSKMLAQSKHERAPSLDAAIPIWAEKKKLALRRAASHLSLRIEKNLPVHPDLDRIRQLIDAHPEYFVSMAVPHSAGIYVGSERKSQGPVFTGLEPRFHEDLREALRSSTCGEDVEVRFLPMLIHVRCRGLESAHRLLKEVAGVADVAATSLDVAKVLVQIRSRVRSVECPVLARGPETPKVLEELAAKICGRVEKSSSELTLLRARLERMLES